MPTLHADRTIQNRRWHPCADAYALEQRVLEAIRDAARHAIEHRGAFHIVLAGGSTPRRIYAALRDIQTDWHAWHVYFGDERCLPESHPERNSHMAASAWLAHVAIPATQIHPIRCETDPAKAAAEYAQCLSRVGSFDMVLLGLGEDGHTASLFPGQDIGDSPEASDTLVVLNAPKPPAQRVSLSAHRLSNTHQVLFMVNGESKRQAVQNWQSGIDIPAARITPARGVDIYLDAALLETSA